MKSQGVRHKWVPLSNPGARRRGKRKRWEAKNGPVVIVRPAKDEER